MGPFGHGIRFPSRPKLDNKTSRKLSLLGLRKMPWSLTEPQTYLGSQTELETIIQFIKAYNHEQYPLNQPAFVAYPSECGDESLLKRAKLYRSDKHPLGSARQ
jgi:hypothetical protein